MLNFLKQRPPVSEALIRQVVAEDPELAKAVDRVLEKQMGPPKNLFKLIPRPRAKMKSQVELVTQMPVDRPYVEPSELSLEGD